MKFLDSIIKIGINPNSSLSALQVLLYAAMGILIVISILALIFLILLVVMPLFAKLSKIKKNKKDSEPQLQPTIVEPVIEEKNNDELVAVIIAAISASQNISSDRFRVVSFRKI